MGSTTEGEDPLEFGSLGFSSLDDVECVGDGGGTDSS